MLAYLLKTQKNFQQNFFNPDTMNDHDKIRWTKEFCLCAHQELAEVMDSINWKTYHLYDKDYPIEATKEELIDVLKFVLNLFVVWNINEEELVKLFDQKTKKTIQRYEQNNNTGGQH